MQVARVEDSGEIWFFTGRGGTVATEIEEEAVVLLSFQKDNSAYLSVRGKARNVVDRNRISEFWKEPYRVWFPGGPGDPNFDLVAVDPIDAEYWDNRGSNKLEYLFEAAKAYVKGEIPDVEEPDHHAKTSL